jgi:hypothetical protein
MKKFFELDGDDAEEMSKEERNLVTAVSIQFIQIEVVVNL